MPSGAFTGYKVIPLQVNPGQRPLWAVYSYGMRNWDLKPAVDHFVAIYTQAQGKWLELARKSFSANDPYVAAPDYVGENGVTQVQIEPSRTWLTVDGGVGAHGGVFDVLSFDGTTLRAEVAGNAASPGLGRIQDVNGDGTPDVVLDVSDHYVFCYACGVTKIMYQVYAWDKANGQMAEMHIESMLMGQSGHPARDLTNQAVSLTEAGLWKDALASHHAGEGGRGERQAAVHQRHGGLGLRPDQAARRRHGTGHQPGRRLPAAEQRLLRRLRGRGYPDAALQRGPDLQRSRRRWSSAPWPKPGCRS